MKIGRSIAVGAAVAMVPVALSMSASPASAMTKSCLSMHVAYEQATLASTHGSSMMTSFRDNAQAYTDSEDFYRWRGWYFDLDGYMVRYDGYDAADWQQRDDYNVATAQILEDQAAQAYDDMVTECGW
jgi:hypothetical protein